MPRFKRIPIEVEAVQVQLRAGRACLSHEPEWLKGPARGCVVKMDDERGFACWTAAGKRLLAFPDDWIVRNTEDGSLSVEPHYNMEAFHEPLDEGFDFQALDFLNRK